MRTCMNKHTDGITKLLDCECVWSEVMCLLKEQDLRLKFFSVCVPVCLDRLMQAAHTTEYGEPVHCFISPYMGEMDRNGQ